jgi:1,4-dihydroxy-2-naphthoate octaprenyltransferase
MTNTNSVAEPSGCVTDQSADGLAEKKALSLPKKDNSKKWTILELIYISIVAGLTLLFPEIHKLWCFLIGQLACLATLLFYALKPKKIDARKPTLLLAKYFLSSALLMIIVMFMRDTRIELLAIVVLSYIAARPLRHVVRKWVGRTQ